MSSRCQGITKKGNRCKNNSVNHQFCRVHGGATPTCENVITSNNIKDPYKSARVYGRGARLFKGVRY